MSVALSGDNVRPDNAMGMMLGIIIAHTAMDNLGLPMVITSLCDGRHSATSLHYAGNAVDIRTNGLRVDLVAAAVNEIKRRLNHHYDVIHEADHIHIEYQPRL